MTVKRIWVIIPQVGWFYLQAWPQCREMDYLFYDSKKIYHITDSSDLWLLRRGYDIAGIANIGLARQEPTCRYHNTSLKRDIPFFQCSLEYISEWYTHLGSYGLLEYPEWMLHTNCALLDLLYISNGCLPLFYSPYRNKCRYTSKTTCRNMGRMITVIQI